MSDALVRKLNELGYQPVFLPRTGLVPPELYNYERDARRLVRRGALSVYLPSVKAVEPKPAELANIAYKYTSDKKTSAAISFLEQALKCIGIDAAPKLDLGFAGSKDFSFAFTGVTSLGVDPAQLDELIRAMSTDGIPRKLIDGGQLHIAYEYAYARELLMSRGDKQSFSADINGKVGAYLDLGVKGSVSVASQSTISFKSNDQKQPAAFAYKAGQLMLEDGRWVLYPEQVSKRGLVEERTPFLPQPAIVLPAIDEE